jgi:eukaryotic-like serine/threonine-protein kinase
MGGQSPDPGSTSAGAVFLSYASQDAEAARQICDALRAAGIEVWFDQSELRGGDAWDRKIRTQIRDCAVFIPIISGNTQQRAEGYFRLEWRLAEQRSHLMGRNRTFILPIRLNDVAERDADVPDSFLTVQWTRVPEVSLAAFAEHVARVLSDSSATAALHAAHQSRIAPAPSSPAAAAAIEPRPVGPHAAQPARRRAGRPRVIQLAVPALFLVVAALVLIPPWQHREHARNVLLPEIENAAAKMFRSNRQIFDKAMEAQKYLPDDPTLAKLLPSIVNTLSVETEPAGAEVFWKDYDTPRADWRSAGVTPLKDARVPRDYLRLEVRKAGYQTIELAAPMFSLRMTPIKAHLRLDLVGKLPENMVRIPKSTTDMQIVGIEKYGPKQVPEFLIDKYEVTNKQFKAFVDAGGYTNTAWWTLPIRDGDKVIPLSAALARFTDRTSRPGPATWEAGSYPNGTENQPVTGVTWYEAAAYAAFVHKQLPTVYHWAAVADTSRSEFVLPLSNFSHKSPSAVGSLEGFSTFGIYDLAGNAREWTSTQRGDSDQHFILGGGWTDPYYAFNDSFTQSALDRSESNGFRCIKELTEDSSASALRQSISMDFRDYSREKPVDDATFAQFSRQFVYDKNPLGATTQKTIESEGWKAEVVSIDAGYNNERLTVYVFLPKNHTGPLQPVVFFPGSNGIHESTFDPTFINGRLDFIVKSGRALIYPVYKGTYERQDDLKSDEPDTTVRYKDHVIMWVKEYSRTLDYLETRKDIQTDKVAYLGWSWGGFIGGIIPAVEQRIKVVVLNVGGMTMAKALPEADQINYLPRVTQPVLMLNGAYDMYFPVESAQKPMFRFLGTPAGEKKMLVYPSGHLVPSTEFIKETLAWLDAHLGAVH